MNLFSKFFGPEIAQIEPKQARAQLNRKPAPILLDVRQPEEYIQGHIAGAKLIPLGELGAHLKELPKNREIICVCRSGHRSRRAAQELVKAGFQAVNMTGGMINWTHQGLPVQKGRAKAA